MALPSLGKSRDGRRVDREDLETCVVLCRRHLIAMQTAQGNFRYEYDWEKHEYSDDDAPVRQAGTLWGLANLNRLRPASVVYDICRRGLAFYDRHSGVTGAGGRFTTYPGERDGSAGSVALVALTLIELLRGATIDAVDAVRWRALLKEYLRYLLEIQLPDGRWPSQYDAAGRPHGDPSPFFDGEALLALTRAARYLGLSGMEDAISRGAAGAYRRYILLALRGDQQSRAAIAYYQWGTMAMYEIVGARWSESERYEQLVYYLADWVCGVRRLGELKHNPAATLEGLIHAFDLARSGASPDQRRLYRETIEVCLQRMLSLQAGHPRAGSFVRRAPRIDPVIGGCQHKPERAKLRIDFALHQLHAAMLALQFGVVESVD
ncbi:MAG: hypothetical protein WB783_03915 [Arenicellales bacterium]